MRGSFEDPTASQVFSPSRARFFAEHSLEPFANDLDADAALLEKASNGSGAEESSGWFKGISNNSLIRMIKNQAFSEFDQLPFTEVTEIRVFKLYKSIYRFILFRFTLPQTKISAFNGPCTDFAR